MEKPRLSFDIGEIAAGPWVDGTTHSANIIVRNPSASYSWTYQVKFYIKSGATTKYSIETWPSFTLAPGATQTLSTGNIVAGWGVGSYTVEITAVETTTGTNLGTYTNAVWNFSLTTPTPQIEIISLTWA